MSRASAETARASAGKSRASGGMSRAKSATLPALERWFQGEIVAPHEDRKRGRPAKEVILPSRSLAPEERVAIYGEMYFLRLSECLAEDYPAVKKLVGPAGFERLARVYLKKHPSRHYSLSALGRKLPDFLAGATKMPRHAMLADVARVERAISESFDAAVSPSLSPADLAMIPPAAWETARIRMTESLRLLALEHRGNAIVTACRQEKELPSLGRARSWAAVFRKEWTVWRMDVSEPMFAVLTALAKGKPLAKSLAAGARAYKGAPEQMQTDVHRWFREWATEGLFVEILR
jgi:Putative DNA-binding domain